MKAEYDLNRILYLLKQFDNFDFVIIEGYKSYNYPKIITSPEVRDEYTIKEVDSFTIDDEGISELADLIERRGHDIVDTLFANNCGFNDGEAIAEEIREGNLKVEDLDKVHSYLSIDNKVVGLNRFVSDYLKQNILGVISTLNLDEYGVEDINKIELVIPDTESTSKIDKKTTILINDRNLMINKFTNDLITNSINAMVNSLKTEGNVEKIDIEISNIYNKSLNDANITLKTNDNPVDINKFTRGILKETIFAVIDTLKIDDEINNIKIKVESD